MMSPAAFWLVAAFLPAAGALAGFMAGLLGVGGGIVLVPSLFYAARAMDLSYDMAMHIAVGTSLAVIVPTGWMSARAHARRGAVDFELLRRFAAGAVAGVAGGTVIAAALSGPALTGLFATALFFLAGVMVFSDRFCLRPEYIAHPRAGFAAFFVGILSTLMGIGGATISVPYMSLCGIKLHRAIGTGAALGFWIAVPAAIGFILIGWHHPGLPLFSLGYVNLAAWALIVPFGMMAAPHGVRAAHALPVGRLRIIFACFMVAVAARMMYDVFAA